MLTLPFLSDPYMDVYHSPYNVMVASYIKQSTLVYNIIIFIPNKSLHGNACMHDIVLNS